MGVISFYLQKEFRSTTSPVRPSSDTNCNDPRTRPSAHAEDPIFAIAAHGFEGPGRAITRVWQDM
ncbi:hypothetical protein Taro_041482 [Colocasia esculenta]|uniref:Uncharacterized protein n=1 Tax=Colocasia esculenta TaxID=4460 RepID=A0A843WW05_COLES|nr:hypothetical protein [Colocasia esculenta]